jgi:hypothetical protein
MQVIEPPRTDRLSLRELMVLQFLLDAYPAPIAAEEMFRAPGASEGALLLQIRGWLRRRSRAGRTYLSLTARCSAELPAYATWRFDMH